MDFFIDEGQIEQEFERLANELLFTKKLNVNGEHFSFTEIEFYYYSEKHHQDAYTHHHNEKEGKWRFHKMGFDFTLRGKTGFGGILIRGVENKGEFINGPLRSLFHIMSYLNDVNSTDNKLGLIEKEQAKSTVYRTFRKGLKTPDPQLKCNNPEGFKNARYRFIIKPRESKQLEQREAIARSFDDPEMSREFFGYNLKS
ncbi:hypothetical protein [Flammeovirga sp. EKP202]|uniref:hypothetical protein n=1 Tax=Flammeovirga sp. EKP202 TaxID=2770592 RepID=UPI00165F0A57|nr:hypothetical protein [Flammeovirga sp. EKP202]MBD0404756.1 hypothetical protein [Flammeovirga sp. EKP202]